MKVNLIRNPEKTKKEELKNKSNPTNADIRNLLIMILEKGR